MEWDVWEWCMGMSYDDDEVMSYDSGADELRGSARRKGLEDGMNWGMERFSNGH